MEEIELEAGIEAALDSILSNRLAVLLGAGLSMAPPTCLPSAANIAQIAKQRYDATYGADRPPLAERVDEQAEFFFRRGELSTVYFRSLIDSNAFGGPPNPGHYAVADLLLVRGIHTAVTTNVDAIVEAAGLLLFGEVDAGIDRDGVVVLPPAVSPMLKVHGCRMRDPANMVWAQGQLAIDPVRSRIASSAQWLQIRLLGLDLLIVGYWTDWDYLNNVLGATLNTVAPSRVLVVDTADSATFEQKAPELYALGQRAQDAFVHVRASGADFLSALRRKFSKTFIRRTLHSGIPDYSELKGVPPNAAWSEPPDVDNDALWQMRRDIEGNGPNQPAKERVPPNEPLLGLTLLQLRGAGATVEGSYWVLNGERIRVLRAANKALHRVQSEFERETAPAIAPDIVIAVGAEAYNLPHNIARASTSPTIARGTASRWITRPQSIEELGL